MAVWVGLGEWVLITVLDGGIITEYFSLSVRATTVKCPLIYRTKYPHMTILLTLVTFNLLTGLQSNHISIILIFTSYFKVIFQHR
jgi:hypothetical protein